jgi:hypothetical protein
MDLGGIRAPHPIFRDDGQPRPVAKAAGHAMQSDHHAGFALLFDNSG